MHVAEDLELAPGAAGQAARADDEHLLGRHAAAPQPAGQRTGRGGDDRQRDHELHAVGRGELLARDETGEAEDGERAGRRPGDEAAELVAREVAHHAVVAVIEPVQLGEQDPDAAASPVMTAGEIPLAAPATNTATTSAAAR